MNRYSFAISGRVLLAVLCIVLCEVCNRHGPWALFITCVEHTTRSAAQRHVTPGTIDCGVQDACWSFSDEREQSQLGVGVMAYAKLGAEL